MNKIYIKTLGCPKNIVDSRQIAGMLSSNGYELTDNPAIATVIIVNTCGFIEAAKEESIETIFEMSTYKDSGCLKLLIATGCMVQKYGEELASALPEVDLFLGVCDFIHLGELIDKNLKAKKRVVVGPCDAFLFNNKWALEQKKEEHTGYVKIAEGCAHHCTYCVIPSIRGGYRSRDLDEIENEVRNRVSKGLREAIIIAQDISDYGKDLVPKRTLAELIKKLIEIKDLKWIRLMYCYPEGITDELIEVMKNDKVVPYLDMPIQHVSDPVLKLMARPITSEKLLSKINRLRKEIPDIFIRTTLMVGFPGETISDFTKLTEFLKTYKLERAGFFAFSPQPGTPAESMPNQVDEDEKERRLEICESMQAEIMASSETRLLGETIDVIVDDIIDDHQYIGRSKWDAPEIDGEVIFNSVYDLNKGDIVKVKISHSQDYSLMGEQIYESAK